MKSQSQLEKFDALIESFVNGNISYVREQVKKLSKEKRKELYQYLGESFTRTEYADRFFFSLI